MTEKRKIGEGASDHTDKRTEASPSELSAEIPAARCRETTNRNSSTSVRPDPTGSPATCCPASPWELTHTLHILGWRTSLLNSPHQEGLGKENKQGGEKATGEVSCSHRLPPPLFSSTRPACGPGEGKAHSRLLPRMPQQITPKQQVSKDPGDKADNWRGFNSISP